MNWNSLNGYYELGAVPKEFQTPGLMNLIATHHKQSPAYHAALQAKYDKGSPVTVHVAPATAQPQQRISAAWIAAGATIAAAIIAGMLRR